MKNVFLSMSLLALLAPLALAQPITEPGEVLKCTVWVAPRWDDGKPHAYAIPVPALEAQTPVLPMEGSVNRVTTLDVSKLGITYHVELQAVDGFSSSTLILDRTAHAIYGTGSIEDLRAERGTSYSITSMGSAIDYLYDGGKIMAANLNCAVSR